MRFFLLAFGHNVHDRSICSQYIGRYRRQEQFVCVWLASQQAWDPQLRTSKPMGSRHATLATWDRRIVTDEINQMYHAISSSGKYRPLAPLVGPILASTELQNIRIDLRRLQVERDSLLKKRKKKRSFGKYFVDQKNSMSNRARTLNESKGWRNNPLKSLRELI